MQFLRYGTLKERLKNRELSEAEILPYLLVSSILYTASNIPGFHATTEPWDWITYILGIVITVIGTYYCYRKNGGKEGHSILRKILCLGWVNFWRVSIIFMPCAIICMFLFSFLPLELVDRWYEKYPWLQSTFDTNYYDLDDADTEILTATNAFDCLIITVYLLLFFWRLGKHISDTK